MLFPAPSAVNGPEQLVQNAVYSKTRSGYAASGDRPGRSGLLVHRFALPQTVRLSAQLTGTQDYNGSRLHVR
jgi:hypothetical protein